MRYSNLKLYFLTLDYLCYSFASLFALLDSRKVDKQQNWNKFTHATQ